MDPVSGVRVHVIPSRVVPAADAVARTPYALGAFAAQVLNGALRGSEKLTEAS
jgi:hypothetical protein